MHARFSLRYCFRQQDSSHDRLDVLCRAWEKEQERESPHFICFSLFLKSSGCSPYLATTNYIGHISTEMNDVVLKILKQAGDCSGVIISVVAMQIPFQKGCVPCYSLHSAHTSTMSGNLTLLCVNEPVWLLPPSETLLYLSTFSLAHLLNLLTTLAERL